MGKFFTLPLYLTLSFSVCLLAFCGLNWPNRPKTYLPALSSPSGTHCAQMWLRLCVHTRLYLPWPAHTQPDETILCLLSCKWKTERPRSKIVWSMGVREKYNNPLLSTTLTGLCRSPPCRFASPNASLESDLGCFILLVFVLAHPTVHQKRCLSDDLERMRPHTHTRTPTCTADAFRGLIEPFSTDVFPVTQHVIPGPEFTFWTCLPALGGKGPLWSNVLEFEWCLELCYYIHNRKWIISLQRATILMIVDEYLLLVEDRS